MDYGFSLGGPVGRPGGQNKLFFYFNLEVNPRTFGSDVNRYRVPTELERQGDFSQSRDNLRRPLSLYQRSAARRHLLGRPTTRPASRMAAWSAGFRQNRLYQTAAQHPEVVARRPTSISRPARPTTTRAWIRRSISSDTSRSSASTTSRRRTIRGSFKFLEYQQPSKVHPGHHTRVQRHAGARLRHLDAGRHVQLDDEPDDVPRGLVRRELPPPGGVLDHRRRAELLPHRPQRDVRQATAICPASATSRTCSPNATVLDPNTFTLLGPQPGRHDDVGRHADRGAAAVRVGHPRRQPAASQHRDRSAANPGVTGGTNFMLDTRNRTWNASLTKVAGRHT